jgi:hypothetical protein
MANETIVNCPHCGAELAIPHNVAQCLCGACHGAVALAPAPATDAAAAPAREEDEWEVVDVARESRTARLLAGFSFLAVGGGLWFAPGLPVWIWATPLAVAAILAVAALIPGRSALGWLFLGLSCAVLAGTLAHWHIGTRRAAARLAALRAPTPAEIETMQRLRAEIAELVAKRQRSVGGLTRVQNQVLLSAPTLQWRRTDGALEAVLRCMLVNRTTQPLKEVFARATVRSRESGERPFETTLRIAPPSVLSAGESVGILQAAPEFQPLTEPPYKNSADLSLSLDVYNARTFTDELLATTFTEEDQAHLNSLEAELAALDRS